MRARLLRDARLHAALAHQFADPDRRRRRRHRVPSISDIGAPLHADSDLDHVGEIRQLPRAALEGGRIRFCELAQQCGERGCLRVR